jgi:hypothetical protein
VAVSRIEPATPESAVVVKPLICHIQAVLCICGATYHGGAVECNILCHAMIVWLSLSGHVLLSLRQMCMHACWLETGVASGSA